MQDYSQTMTAVRIGVSIPTLCRMTKRGDAPASYKVGKRRFYVKAEVDKAAGKAEAA